jgi:hypothetical protein
MDEKRDNLSQIAGITFANRLLRDRLLDLRISVPKPLLLDFPAGLPRLLPRNPGLIDLLFDLG